MTIVPCYDWVSEVVWCAQLLTMYREHCDNRGLDERWYDEMDERRRWVKVQMRIGHLHTRDVIITGKQYRRVNNHEAQT